MRDKWHLHLRCNWYELTLKERGMLATIYNESGVITLAFDDADTMFGKMWIDTANRLERKKAIEIERVSFGVFRLKLIRTDEKRRQLLKKINLRKKMQKVNFDYN